MSSLVCYPKWHCFSCEMFTDKLNNVQCLTQTPLHCYYAHVCATQQYHFGPRQRCWNNVWTKKFCKHPPALPLSTMRSVVDWHWLGFGCGCGGWSSVESSGFSFWTFRRSWGPCFDAKHTQNWVSATQQTLLVERQRCEISSRSCCLEISIWFVGLSRRRPNPSSRTEAHGVVEGVVHLKVTGEVSKKHLRKENLEPFVLPKMALVLMWHVHWQAEQRSVFNSDSVSLLLRLRTIQCHIFELYV